MVVEGIGRLVEVVTHLGESRGATVPVRNTVGRSVLDEPIAGGASRFQHHVLPFGATAEWFEIGVGKGFEKLELFREADHGPSESTGPGGETGVALLGVRATEATVVWIEDGFVSRAAPFVVAVAAFAVEHGVAGGGFDVLERTAEEGDSLVVFTHERMPELVGHHNDAAGTDRIDEERLRSVEGVDVSAAIVSGGVARSLNGTG